MTLLVEYYVIQLLVLCVDLKPIVIDGKFANYHYESFICVLKVSSLYPLLYREQHKTTA